MEVAETATKILIPELSRLCKDSRNASRFLALEIPRCSMPPPIVGVFRTGNLPAEASEPRRLASAVVPGLTGLHCSAYILFARS